MEINTTFMPSTFKGSPCVAWCIQLSAISIINSNKNIKDIKPKALIHFKGMLKKPSIANKINNKIILVNTPVIFRCGKVYNQIRIERQRH